MAPFESRETLEPTAYDGPVSASRRHSRLRHGCEARRARAQQTFSRRNEKLLADCREDASRALWKHILHAKEKHTFQEKKGCCAESDTLEASRSVTLTCARRNVVPAPPCSANALLPPDRSMGG